MKLGELVKIDGVTCIVTLSTRGCEGCAFQGTTCIGGCSAARRRDRKDVIYRSTRHIKEEQAAKDAVTDLHFGYEMADSDY